MPLTSPICLLSIPLTSPICLLSIPLTPPIYPFPTSILKCRRFDRQGFATAGWNHEENTCAEADRRAKAGANGRSGGCGGTDCGNLSRPSDRRELGCLGPAFFRGELGMGCLEPLLRRIVFSLVGQGGSQNEEAAPGSATNH